MENTKNNSYMKLIPVMLCFFAMGFVDLVGIASNYVKADLGLTDSQANIFPSLVLLVRHIEHCLRENDGEYIRVAKPDQGNTDINHRLVLENEQPEHGGQHTQHTDSEEGFSRHLLQNESSQKTTCRTENEVKTGRKPGIRQSHAQTFHQNLRCCSIGTHIDPHMTHNAQKREQDEGFTQQSETLTESGRFALFRFFGDLRGVSNKIATTATTI